MECSGTPVKTGAAHPRGCPARLTYQRCHSELDQVYRRVTDGWRASYVDILDGGVGENSHKGEADASDIINTCAG